MFVSQDGERDNFLQVVFVLLFAAQLSWRLHPVRTDCVGQLGDLSLDATEL